MVWIRTFCGTRNEAIRSFDFSYWPSDSFRRVIILFKRYQVIDFRNDTMIPASQGDECRMLLK